MAKKRPLPSSLAPIVKKYQLFTKRVARWLAKKMHPFGHAWAQTTPLRYTARDLENGAQEIHERVIAVPQQIATACHRAAEYRLMVADYFERQHPEDEDGSNAGHRHFATILRRVSNRFCHCPTEPAPARKPKPRPQPIDTTIKEKFHNLYAILEDLDDGDGDGEVDVMDDFDWSDIVDGAEMDDVLAAPSDDPVNDVFDMSFKPRPLFESELQTCMKLKKALQEIYSELARGETSFTQVCYILAVVSERLAGKLKRGLRMNSDSTVQHITTLADFLEQELREEDLRDEVSEKQKMAQYARHLALMIERLGEALEKCGGEKAQATTSEASAFSTPQMQTNSRRKQTLCKSVEDLCSMNESSGDTVETTIMIKGALLQAFASGSDDSGLDIQDNDPRFKWTTPAKIIREAVGSNQKVNWLSLAILIDIFADSSTVRTSDSDKNGPNCLKHVQNICRVMLNSLEEAIGTTSIAEDLSRHPGEGNGARIKSSTTSKGNAPTRSNVNTRELARVKQDLKNLRSILSPFLKLADKDRYAQCLASNAGTMVYIHEKYLCIVDRLLDCRSFTGTVCLYRALEARGLLTSQHIFHRFAMEVERFIKKHKYSQGEGEEMEYIFFTGAKLLDKNRNYDFDCEPNHHEFSEPLRLDLESKTMHSIILQRITGKVKETAATAAWAKEVRASGQYELVHLIHRMKETFHKQFNGDMPTAELDLAKICVKVVGIGEDVVARQAVGAAAAGVPISSEKVCLKLRQELAWFVVMERKYGLSVQTHGGSKLAQMTEPFASRELDFCKEFLWPKLS